ncbi:MAG: spore germination protein [Clostridia bacterium]|nr:spore germination protein [Clostridia bacterium]
MKFESFKQLFSDKNQVECKEFCVGTKKIHIFYVDCLVDKQVFSNAVLNSITRANAEAMKQKKKSVLELLETNIVSTTVAKKIYSKDEAMDEIFKGNAIIIDESADFCLLISVAGGMKRAIQEPPTSAVVKGPREGFIEDIHTNKALIRKRLKTQDLSIVELQVGEKTKTIVNILYLSSIADEKIVSAVKARIEEIDIDGILDSFYISQFLQKGKDKFFKRVGTTEKPDITVSKLLEGRVAILVDGSPIVLTVPFLLFEDLQSVEDYYDIPAKATLSRFIRFFGIFISILLPGFYVALESYHYKVLPINFLINLLGSLENISLPPMLEILFVIFLFDILNEASVRMPKQLGMALSIIGALILGDTAVQAGIISSPSIVVVAISGITLYIIPDQVPETSILRSIFTVIGGIAGFYGLICSSIVLAVYLVSITSFGSPYMAPYAPDIRADKKDGIVKAPITDMKTRPFSIHGKNKKRMGN